ncbi:MAG TPA: SLBB domain-containing protein [Gemmatimonadales bacterium]|nr:SLBB domain-containing protein [Gemmatimonadales bacterium]
MRFPGWGVVPLLTMLLVATVSDSAAGQNPPIALPPPSQAQAALEQALQQNPALATQIRNRLLQSGMTPDQVRARLQASGYPPTLLDAFMGSDTLAGAPSRISVDQVAAIQAIGLQPLSVSLVNLPIDTGFIRAVRARAQPESVNAVFGVDAFRRTTTQFLPLLSGPVPPDYKLGPGDQLVLILTGDVELTHTLPVTREGFVLIPQVGQVFVSNLTLDQLRETLYTRLGRVYSGVRRNNATTHFDVSVANVRANQIYVTGEVNQPGAYQISSLGTALTALYAAGGVTQRADMRQVLIRRSGQVVDTLDLYDYLLRGDTRRDKRLETGDVVFVPAHGQRAQVIGAVSRPAIYAIKPGETLAGLLRAAGGFRPDATLQRVTIFRYLPASERRQPSLARVTVDVALAPASRGDASVGDVAVPLIGLEDGDSVVVDSLPPLSALYTVGIAGMVNKPGMFPWHPGMTLRELMLLARGPRIGAYLKEAEVARLPSDRSAGQLATTIRVPLDSTYLIDRDSLGRYIGPPGLPFPASGATEIQLEPFDNVLVLRQPDFDYQRTVTVLGEVRYPGVYSLQTKNDRLSQVMTRAGGLTHQAYPDGIRFIRTQNDVGRINVDLARALSDTASSANLVLQPGDSIYLPEYQPSVKVSGAVNSPGSVLWRRGADLSYYLSAAGGFAQRADKGGVSVRFANGEVRTRGHGLFHGDPRPGPGSEVFVPAEDPTVHRTDYVALFGAIAQILASALTIAVVATKL